VHNVQTYESEITHAKSSKRPEMFQWDAVDTSPDLAGRNVLKTSEMAIPHDVLTTRTELKRVFHRWIHLDLLSKNIFLALLRGAGGGRSPPSPLWIGQCTAPSVDDIVRLYIASRRRPHYPLTSHAAGCRTSGGGGG